jgi:hypothetical protein
MRALKLAQRALAGDVEACILWLATYGPPHYRQVAVDLGYIDPSPGLTHCPPM